MKNREEGAATVTILELDQGNTRGKWRLLRTVFGGEVSGAAHGGSTSASSTEVVARGSFAPGSWWEAEELPAAWLQFPPEKIRAANVAGAIVGKSIAQRLQRSLDVSVAFARVTPECEGVRCAYDRVDRLGVDRWLAVLAAYNRDSSPAMVVDCGSAVTLDLLGGGGAHLGGYIVPGMSLMRRALHCDTDAVKVAEPEMGGLPLAPGRNTEDAVNRGLPLMVVGAVERAYDALVHQCAVSGERAPRLLFTGGDGAQIASLCDRPNQLVEDLVMEGLALTNP